MDENKVIRPMDFVRLTNIDELNVIKDTKNHIGLVKEVSRDGSMSVIWIGDIYSRVAWFNCKEVETACMGKVGEGTRRPPMFVGLAEQIKLQCSDIIKVKITI